MTKILMFTRDFPPMYGGVSTYTYEVFNRLKKKYSTDILTPEKLNVSQNSTLSFVVNGTLNGLNKNFDLIFGTTYFHSVPGVLLKILRRKPLITTIHDLGVLELRDANNFLHVFKTLAYRFSVENSDAILVPSPEIKKQVKNIFNIPSTKIHVIPNGFDKKSFNTKIKKNEIRKKLGIPKNKKIILTSGTYPKKDLLSIVEACRILKYDLKFGNFLLIVIGGFDKRYGWYMNRVKENISKFNLTENVKFVGGVKKEELPSYYKDSDVFVSASYYGEGFGIPIVEANGVGKPVVATDIFEKNGVIVNGKTGLVVPVKNPQKLANAVYKILLNSKFSIKLGKNGLIFSKKFDWDNYVEKLSAIIDSLVKN